MLGLFPFSGYCEQSCCEHFRADIRFHFSGAADIQGRVLISGGCAGHRGTFCSVPGAYPLEATW